MFRSMTEVNETLMAFVRAGIIPYDEEKKYKVY
jgi:hypothetical protein